MPPDYGLGLGSLNICYSAIPVLKNNLFVIFVFGCIIYSQNSRVAVKFSVGRHSRLLFEKTERHDTSMRTADKEPAHKEKGERERGQTNINIAANHARPHSKYVPCRIAFSSHNPLTRPYVGVPGVLGLNMLY